MTATHTTWHVLGASVAGSSHRASGRGCDDAHGWRLLTDGILLLTAADGAGSAARGAEGAGAAVQAALDSLTLALLWAGPPTDQCGWERLMWGVVTEARAALEDLPLSPNPLPHEGGGGLDRARRGLSKRSGLHEPQPHCTNTHRVESSPLVGEDGDRREQERGLVDFATTLLVAVVADGWVAAAQVGDGAIVIEGHEGMQALTLPDHGEYLNETVFLTSDDYRERARVVTLPYHGSCRVALLTDGLEGLALNLADGSPHAPFFAPLFCFVAEPDASEEELIAFLESARVCARTDDDKTLLLAVRV